MPQTVHVSWQSSASADWGTVPAWFGAALTGGSLLLGLYILLRDRRKEERTEASLVVCWRVWNENVYVTHIYNASKRTIVDVFLLLRLPKGSAPDPRIPWVALRGPAVIRREAEESIESRRGERGDLVPEFVFFQDADGIFWIRNLPRGDLRRFSTTRAGLNSTTAKLGRRLRSKQAADLLRILAPAARTEDVDDL
jgi:hypothetical protein